MARLPNGEKAIIDTQKLRNYILSPSHPVGRFKAAAFRRLGYSEEDWETLERNLRQMILYEDAVELEESQFGKKFVVQGSLAGPSDNAMKVVTVWVILKGESIPRFVTAYPGEA